MKIDSMNIDNITQEDLNNLEKYADRLFQSVGIDVEFTKHFLERANDIRNKRQITFTELVELFRKTYQKYGRKIAELGDGAEAVINDMKSDLNMPFVLDWKKRTQELDLIAKTIMRKKNFLTHDPKLRVESIINKYIGGGLILESNRSWYHGTSYEN